MLNPTKPRQGSDEVHQLLLQEGAGTSLISHCGSLECLGVLGFGV